MMHSLRTRLVLMIVVVTAAAVATVGLLSSKVTTNEFRRYIASDDASSLDRLSGALTDHYRSTGHWAGVQDLLDRIGDIAGKQLILVDTRGSVLAAAPPDLLKATIVVTPDHSVSWERVENNGSKRVLEKVVLVKVPHRVINDVESQPVGVLYAVTSPPPASQNRTEFVGTVNRSLVFVVIGGGAAALLLTLMLTGRILRPIESLTAAARCIEKGDLTRRVTTRSRHEIGVLAQAFNSMADKLVRTEELRRNMVTDIAHELRTPLTNIRCQLETLQDGLARPEPAIIDSLHEEAMLLSRLVDDLQDLALAEAGMLDLSREPIPVDRAIADAVSAVQAQARDKNVEVVFHRLTALPLVDADSRRVGQVLRNLLSNALAQTASGGHIDVTAGRYLDCVKISVSDTGVGIRPEHLPHVFERFYRTDGSRARASGGSGLGLAIVRQLVKAHGGEVSVESFLGRGSTFAFTLPVSSNSVPAPAPQNAAGLPS